MKSTGVIRPIDSLGRIVIPSELRKMFDIDEKDSMEVYVDGEYILLKKYQPSMSCAVTGQSSMKNLTLADGKLILSPDVAKELAKEILEQTE